MFSQGHTRSRQSAKSLIESGSVLLDGARIAKPSQDIDDSKGHSVEILNRPRFVSRGGEKLDFALDRFGIDVTGMSCIDIGASTGGFTDCLLQRGAAAVCALDSGHSQLDPSVSADTRVTSIEKYNARFMSAEDLGSHFDLAVMDVSFISQTLIHRGVYDVLREGCAFISLIKPQFECGREGLDPHGIVKKPQYRRRAICRVIDSAIIAGFSCVDIVRSPIEGGSGNVEYLMLMMRSASPENTISEKKIDSIL